MFIVINIVDLDLTHDAYGKNNKQPLVFWVHHMDRILKAILMFGDGPKNFPMLQGVEFEIPNYFWEILVESVITRIFKQSPLIR